MIRQLGKLTSIELLKPGSEETKMVCDRLRNENRLSKARIHPINILAALYQYKKGKGMKGKLKWSPVEAVCLALNDAFYKAFKVIISTPLTCPVNVFHLSPSCAYINEQDTSLYNSNGILAGFLILLSKQNVVALSYFL